MRLLNTGAAGMLGRELGRVARHAGHSVHGLDRVAVDIRDARAVHTAVAGESPDVVINCAAWTDVDGAEADVAAAIAVNGIGAGNVAAAAAMAGAWVVHVSTDYVFEGTQARPYVESDRPAPLSAYGRSKLAGEVAVAAAAPRSHTIVRTSWLFGVHGRNFVETMLRLGAEREEVTVVDDQLGCPTFAGHLAPALLEVAVRRSPEILHVAGRGHCSWFDLAAAVFEREEVDCRLRRGRTADLARPAPRPAFSVLGSTRPDAPALPQWQRGLDDYLAARLRERGARA